LALTLLFFTKFLTKEGIIGVNDKYFLIFTATMSAAIFFVLYAPYRSPSHLQPTSAQLPWC
jgi:hypothetical protein